MEKKKIAKISAFATGRIFHFSICFKQLWDFFQRKAIDKSVVLFCQSVSFSLITVLFSQEDIMPLQKCAAQLRCH